MMNAQGQSDRSVVSTKPPNNAEEPAAEAGERRERPKGNSPERNASRTQRRTHAPSALSEYVKQPSRTGNSGSPRCCTTCMTRYACALRMTP